MLEDIVREINLTLSKSLGIRIELIKWETHVSPGIGKDPQHIINSQIGDDYDIFIGIMWARFGTDTGRFGSGTEEEFERAYARFLKDEKSVEIMFYFKDAGIPPSEIDLNEVSRVLEFKKKLGSKGALYGAYSTREEFGQHLRACFENRSGRDCERGGADGEARRGRIFARKSVTEEQRSQTPRPAARPPGIFSKHVLRLHLSRVVQNWNANHSKADTEQSGLKIEQHEDAISDEVGFLDAIETSQEHLAKLSQITTRMTESVF